jgi:hypothetical protein
MTPLSFEWQWNADYIIFMGLLYIALAVVGCGLIYAVIKTWVDLGDAETEGEPPQEISYRSRYSDY